MARLPLLLWPNLLLRDKSQHLTFEDVKSDWFKERLERLHETLIHYRGVGLSAVQVKWPVRMFAMRTTDSVQTFVNPEIVSVDGDAEMKTEGCLSLPGIFNEVARYPNVVIVANDMETWERKSFDLEGLEAQCAQHEIEHMDGLMAMVDNIGPVKRDILKRKIRKQLRINPLYNGDL